MGLRGIFYRNSAACRAEFEAKLKATGTGTVGCVALDQNGKLL
jgi:isoaspartyl peptidase/L-asparaginase-like protein (Ntn-hydrolase superfamily)